MKTVILAAGFGSRLWPLSTSEKPKQFQPLLGKQSLLQYTYELLHTVVPTSELYVLTLSGLQTHVKEQLPTIVDSQVLTVPERRNTLPHTLFALKTITASTDEPVLFSTVDHLIVEPNLLLDSLKKLSRLQTFEHLTLLATASSNFDANAGYMQVTNEQHISRFIEKPTEAELHALQIKGQVYKDTAMFIASQLSLLEALASMPGSLHSKATAFLAADGDQLTTQYLQLPFIDIATGCYEKASTMQALLVAGDYIDLGRYETLYAIQEKDKRGNAATGSVIFDDASTNTLAINQLSSPLVVIAQHDMVIVQAETGTVVTPLSQANEIGEIYKTRIHH